MTCRLLSGFLPFTLAVAFLLPALCPPAQAHHVLGRPTYSLNEDGSTPPALTLETSIGKYLVTMMAFPAFLEPGDEGRISLHAARIHDNAPFDGTVSFHVRDDAFLESPEEKIGDQQANDHIFRQAMVFSQEGNYIVTARFQADGEPYVIDFPVQVGQPLSVLTLAVEIGVGATALALILLRKRLRRFHQRQGRLQGALARGENPGLPAPDLPRDKEG